MGNNAGLKYVGPVFDSSGYAKACRDNIFALHDEGFAIKVEPHCFDKIQGNSVYRKNRELLGSMVSADVQYDVVISQLTPDMAVLHKETNKYNVAFFAWESSVVHPRWVEDLNQMDEVWVPCEWNIESLRSSGVTVPITKIPHAANSFVFKENYLSAFDFFSEVDKSTYLFYNIFQWQPRKNPEALLRAYFNAFTSKDDVALILKTYVANSTTSEANDLANEIRKIKNDMLLPNEVFPRVLLVVDRLSDDQMTFIHKRCDCCVSLHCSEGWGLVPFEAGVAGNPVIATGATGNMEYMTEENSFPVDFQWEYINKMSIFNRWYLGTGKWASPNQTHAAQLMRYVYENREAAKEKGLLLKKRIESEFTYKKVAQQMKKRIFEIRSEV